jgi:hypothetical protein
LETGFKLGARFAFTKAALPHEIGRAASTTRNLELFVAIDADQLWVDFVALGTFNLRAQSEKQAERREVPQRDENLEKVIKVICGGLETRDILEFCFDF